MNHPFFNNAFDNSALYSLVEMYKANSVPLSMSIRAAQEWLNSPYNPLSYMMSNKPINALLDLSERMIREYPKPEFNIHKVIVDKKEYYIEQEIIIEKNFCRLLHFRKLPQINLPKLLIVVPLSGHYPTLLKGTIEATLPYFDVYITEWINARDVPLSKGNFDFDDYIDYCIEFMNKLAPNLTVMAVCQPAVPVSAAVSIMSTNGNHNVPTNLILIGGPMDARISPNKISDYTADKEIHWFQNNVITRVPINYPGFLREVYPGFLQLAGFMSMNMKRHIGEHVKLFEHLIIGDEDSVDSHTKFYDEYLAVMDLTAEFYLQTIKEVFIDHSLPQGKLVSRGRSVDLKAINKSALLVLEGELDDITGRGQTKAALELCSGISADKKEYHLQKSVGHYGLFNGSKFRNNIVPLIKEFSYRHLK